MTGWGTPILHADLDAFYASVAVLRDPALAGKPVIVGGTSNRGVVTSASYEARRFGVDAGMPTSRARRLCPDGVFVPPDFDAYQESSRAVREVFDAFSPAVEPLALDEAFLDVRGARRLWPDPAALAGGLRAEVRRRTGLAVSVGVASNKFLAKLASRLAKPDGVLIVPPQRVARFLHPLPVSHLWGVGEHTVPVLQRLGLSTIGDVAAVPAPALERALGSLGTHIARLAAGVDARPVVPDAPRKSVGAEETFERDLVEDVQILQALLALSDRVSSRLRWRGISGQTVTVKVRFASFVTVTRTRTLDREVDGAAAIYRAARELLVRGLREEGRKRREARGDPAPGRRTPFPPPDAPNPLGRRRIRLLGASVSNLKEWPASDQLSFERAPRWADADRALDRVRARFGEGSLGFAALLNDI